MLDLNGNVTPTLRSSDHGEDPFDRWLTCGLTIGLSCCCSMLRIAKDTPPWTNSEGYQGPIRSDLMERVSIQATGGTLSDPGVKSKQAREYN